MSLLFLFAKIISEFAPNGWMAQPAQRLRFDLSDTFARDTHLAANFFESVSLPVEQAISKLQDADFARRQAVQYFAEMFAQKVIGCGIIGRRRLIVFDEIAQNGILFIVRGRFERQGTPRHLDHVLDFFRRNI